MNQFGLAVTVKTLIILPNESRSSLTSGGGTFGWLSIDIDLDFPHPTRCPWHCVSIGTRWHDHVGLQAIGKAVPCLGKEAARRLAVRPPADDIDTIAAPVPRIPGGGKASRVNSSQSPRERRRRAVPSNGGCLRDILKTMRLPQSIGRQVCRQEPLVGSFLAWNRGYHHLNLAPPQRQSVA